MAGAPHSGAKMLARTASRRWFSTATAAGPKPIPTPSGHWPLLGHLPRLVQGEGVQNWAALHDECGDIFEVHLAGTSLIVTRDLNHGKEILMNQGRYPVRTHQPSWKAIFDEQQWPDGIPFSTGDDWKRRRQVLGETLLMQKNAKEYVGVVLPAANRFVSLLQGHLTENGRIADDSSVRLLAGMFALEAVMKVVVGVDFDAQSVPLNESAKDFASSVETMFANSAIVEQVPWHITFQTKPYQRLRDAWKTMYRYPTETLQPVLDYYQEHGQLPPQANGTVLPKLIEQYEAGDISMDELIGIGVQTIAAAIDTTGQTTEYLFYNLARHPDVQDRIVEELQATTCLTVDEPLHLTVEEYTAQKYLFAVLRESMRVTPTIGAHARTLVQDADLGDYRIPAGKLVLINYLAMSQNPELYPDPHMFLPERFFKNESSPVGCPMRQAAIDKGSAVVNDPFAAIPFGHGARKCVGKAFAELDVHLLTAALLRRYRIEYDGPELVQVEKNLLRPKTPLTPHFRFVPRE